MKKLFNYLKDDFFHKFIFILLSLLLIFLFIKKDPFRFYFLPIYLLFYVFPFCNHIIDKFLGNDKKTYYSSYSETYYPPSKKIKIPLMLLILILQEEKLNLTVFMKLLIIL